MAEPAFAYITPEPLGPAPEGFAPLDPRSPFMAMTGPYFMREEADGTRSLGVWVRPEICNAWAGAHGGFVGTFADIALTIVTTGITLNLSVDYLRPAPVGSWMEARVSVRKSSATLAFADAIIEAEGRAIARISGLFKPYVKRS